MHQHLLNISYKGEPLNSLGDDVLTELVDQFPYVSLLHLQQATHLQDTNSRDKKLHTVSLFFNNQAKLFSLLNQSKEDTLAFAQPEAENEIAENSSSITENQIQHILQREIEIAKDQKADLPAFEPLHAVDYFASQGIQYIPEETPNDNFSKQLKSFTEWIKTMKRLNVQALPENNKAEEEKIARMANESNTPEEVITESMAAVLEKQNKYSAAIEIYNKLSLLYPEKSAYFAAKIEKIK